MWLILSPTLCYFVINHNIWSVKTASSFLRSNKKGDKSALPMSLALQMQTSATPNNKFYHKPEGKKKTLRTHFLQRPIPRPVIFSERFRSTSNTPFSLYFMLRLFVKFHMWASEMESKASWVLSEQVQKFWREENCDFDTSAKVKCPYADLCISGCFRKG